MDKWNSIRSQLDKKGSIFVFILPNLISEVFPDHKKFPFGCIQSKTICTKKIYSAHFKYDWTQHMSLCNAMFFRHFICEIGYLESQPNPSMSKQVSMPKMHILNMIGPSTDPSAIPYFSGILFSSFSTLWHNPFMSKQVSMPREQL